MSFPFLTTLFFSGSLFPIIEAADTTSGASARYRWDVHGRRVSRTSGSFVHRYFYIGNAVLIQNWRCIEYSIASIKVSYFQKYTGSSGPLSSLT